MPPLPGAYGTPLPPASTGSRHESATPAQPALVVAAGPYDIERFPCAVFARHGARTTAEAVRLIERLRPRIVAIDWDLEAIDGAMICAAAQRIPGAGVLALIGSPQRAPAALKAGCHALLLTPCAPNLIAARIGRLSREMPSAAIASRLAEKLGQFGTNRMWPDVACPSCAKGGAVAFEFSSHRRSWYACLSCERVWLGRRQE
jgi:CheY-like chemotaxis protein